MLVTLLFTLQSKAIQGTPDEFKEVILDLSPGIETNVIYFYLIYDDLTPDQYQETLTVKDLEVEACYEACKCICVRLFIRNGRCNKNLHMRC